MKNALTGLIALFVIGVLVAAGTVYLALFGSPFGARMARQQMEQYLAASYPDRAFTIHAVTYDPKFGRYLGRVSDEQANAFQLHASEHGVEYDPYRYTIAMDEELTERFNRALEQELRERLGPRFPQLRSIAPGLYVPAGALPADSQPPVDAPLSLPEEVEHEPRMEIYLVGEDLPAEAFARLSAEIRDAILRAGYQPRAMRLLYNQPEDAEGRGGMLYYALTIERGEYTLPASMLLAQVESFNQQHRDD